MAAGFKDSGQNDSDDLSEIRVRRDSPALGTRDAFLELKNDICRQILNQIEPGLDSTQPSQLRPYVHDRLDAILEESEIIVNRNEKRQLLEAIVADIINMQS